MATYNSLAGYKVKRHEGEITQRFNKGAIESLFTDPITQDWFKEPVYFRGNIYDKHSLQQWFRKSDIDPLTGENIDGNYELIPCNLIKYLIYALEEDGDELIFHSPPNCLQFAQKIATYLPIKTPEMIQDISIIGYMLPYSEYSHTNEIISGEQIKKQFEMNDLSNVDKLVNCTVKNCHPLDKIKAIATEGTTVESNIDNYRLEEYLFVSIVTSKIMKPDDMVISANGYIIDSEFQGMKIDGYRCGSMEEFLSHADVRSCSSFKNMGIRMIESLKPSYIETSYKPVWIWFYPNLGKLKKVSTDDVTMIKIRSAAVKYYESLQLFKLMIQDDPSLAQGLEKLSSMINNDTINRFKKDGPSIDELRESLGIPFIQDKQNTYGYDLSMLNLSNKEFTKKNFKDYCFVGADLRGAVFNGCDISCSSFVGADLRGTEFIACKFNYMREFSGGPFYKTQINNHTKFIISLGPEADMKYFEDLYDDNGMSL